MWLEEVKKIWKSGPKAHKCTKGAREESTRGGCPPLVGGGGLGVLPRKICKFLDANHGIWWHLASLVGSWHTACAKRNYIQKGKPFLMFSQIVHIKYITYSNHVHFKTVVQSWNCNLYHQQLGVFILHFGFGRSQDSSHLQWFCGWGLPSVSFFDGHFTDERSKDQHTTVCRWDVHMAAWPHTLTSIKTDTVIG